MTKPGLTTALAVLCAIAPLAGRAAPITGAQDGWAAITACAHTADEEARRDCMDGVLRRAGLLSPGAGAPATPARADDRSNVLRLPFVSAPDAPTGELTVAKSQVDFDGRLLFVTSDGQKWRSQDVGAPRPRQGQAITISSNIMGSYDCRLGRFDSFLCMRDASTR